MKLHLYPYQSYRFTGAAHSVIQLALSVEISPSPSFDSLGLEPNHNPERQGYLSMATISLRTGNARLPPEVNRALYVRNLPFNITSEEMYDIFGKQGAIRQVRIGTSKDTRGTAFVVYEDIYDAKTTSPASTSRTGT